MNNPEKLATYSTQDTGQINVREHRRGNQNEQSDKFSIKTWIKLYNSVILPIITYGSEIWLTDFNLNLDTLDKLRFSIAYFNKPVFLNTTPRYLYLSVISIIL
jgi:hypothetical protein